MGVIIIWVLNFLREKGILSFSILVAIQVIYLSLWHLPKKIDHFLYSLMTVVQEAKSIG